MVREMLVRSSHCVCWKVLIYCDCAHDEILEECSGCGGYYCYGCWWCFPQAASWKKAWESEEIENAQEGSHCCTIIQQGEAMCLLEWRCSQNQKESCWCWILCVVKGTSSNGILEAAKTKEKKVCSCCYCSDRWLWLGESSDWNSCQFCQQQQPKLAWLEEEKRSPSLWSTVVSIGDWLSYDLQEERKPMSFTEPDQIHVVVTRTSKKLILISADVSHLG